ncbi:MAG: HAMP domain-containing sensor histidine kinase [Pseudomonadota bacterium]
MSASTDSQSEIPAIREEEQPERGRLGPIVFLLGACFVLVATPLVIAISVAYFSVEGLSDAAAREVEDTSNIAAFARDVARDITELRRFSRQAPVVAADKELYEDLYSAVTSRQIKMSKTIHNLLNQPIDESPRRQLHELLEMSAALLVGFVERPEDPDRLAMIDEMQRLVDEVITYPETKRLQVTAQVRERAQRTLDVLTKLLVAAIPTAALLIVLFTFLISQSMRDITGAIKQLGDNRFEDRISVKGPADLRALGGELDVLRDRLQQAEIQKQRFLRHMSHELKTPLASLLEGTELFVDGSLGHLPTAQSEVAGILRSNAQELRHLIENLLDYSAWQSHGSTLRCTEFDLQVLCSQVLDQYRLMMRTRRVTVDQRVVPVDLMADRDKLRTVLSNLLSNAIKYTPENGTIFLRAYRAGGHLLLDIADSGPNIPEAERAHVFEPFYTGTPPQQAHLKGSGIGLSLVREYVRAHGGEVNLVDGIYRGAHFRIRMPVKAQSGPVRVSA